MALDLAWSVGYPGKIYTFYDTLQIWLPFGIPLILVLLLAIQFLRSWWTIRQDREAAAAIHDFGEALQATEAVIEQSTAEPEDQA